MYDGLLLGGQTGIYLPMRLIWTGLMFRVLKPRGLLRQGQCREVKLRKVLLVSFRLLSVGLVPPSELLLGNV